MPAAASLIQADDGQQVMLSDLDQAFAMIHGAYFPDPGTTVDPRLIRDARLRLLQQMSEELAIRCRAKELGIGLDAAELDAAIRALRKACSENGFSGVGLNGDIPFSVWKDRVAAHLLMRKVVAADLSAAIVIAPEEVQAFIEDHPDLFPRRAGLTDETETAPGSAGPEEAVRMASAGEMLRREKMEAQWPRWMASLKIRYHVRINWELWEGSQHAAATAPHP